MQYKGGITESTIILTHSDHQHIGARHIGINNVFRISNLIHQTYLLEHTHARKHSRLYFIFVLTGNIALRDINIGQHPSVVYIIIISHPPQKLVILIP